MPVDAKRSDLVLAVIGTGAMGRGIAQIAALGGIKVLLHDAKQGAADEASAFVCRMVDRLVEKGKLDDSAAGQAKDRLQVVSGVADLAPADVVVEAIVERLDIKQELFRELESVVRPDAILATNTSSLSVTAIAAACEHPERVAGFHFFNPVPLMKLVEVATAVRTADWAAEALVALAKRMGHTPVLCIDSPGFIVNHAGRGFGTEALRILGEGICETIDMDRVMRETAGFRMGPFELLDLTALDVSHNVMESIYDQYYQEPRFRPSFITRQRLAAGLLGRKVGEGFYRYPEGKPEQPAETPAPTAGNRAIWISKADADSHKAVTDMLSAAGAELDQGSTPAAESVCLVTPLGLDATSTALEQGLDPQRTVALDTLFDLGRRRTLMTTPVTLPDVRDAAHAALAKDGVPVTVIRDSAGFIAQRIVATIVNIGCDIAQQRIATPEDIETGVKLGLGYPHGPLGFGDTLGPKRILQILETMQSYYGDPRYRPSPWLKRRAMLGVSLTTPES
ncbi:MAG: 3-hydroxyacyl-CoA dehydrogenase [Ectothiorhodospiraceae bacterium]|nr:3-hydroxyacyl-CoA dehydrogenase [Ectothiorhodospiraceae bacterium]